MEAAAVAVKNPFPGLRPFDFDTSHLFFGRDEQTDELLARLRRSRFVTVLGSSGSGKSSLVRAGLLPALEAGFLTGAGSRWRVAVIRPGHEPIRNLSVALSAAPVLGSTGASAEAVRFVEATLRRGALGLGEAVRQARLQAGENLLVVVDQFEELFRFRSAAHADDESAAFVKLLLESSKQPEPPIYVVLTMRSDFLGDCSQFRDLPETINDGVYLIPRMRRDQLREAITGPAGVAGTTIAPRLVQQILNDIGDDPDQLPLLQHSLMRTWCAREDGRSPGAALDLEHYAAIGGLKEALSRHAEEVYAGLPVARQRIAERLFRCLSEKGPDNREVRRPTTASVLGAVIGASLEELTAVIDTFRAPDRAFLMPPAGTSIEPDTVIDISHESLIRQWGRLRGWVEEEADFARRMRNISEAAAAYAAGEGDMLRGAALDANHDWWQRAQPSKAWAARHGGDFTAASRYLEASLEARASEREREEAARRRELEHEEERRRGEGARQRARWLLLAAALVSSSFAWLAWRAWRAEQRATGLSQAAEQQTRVARSRELAFAARSNLAADPELAVMLAQMALQENPTKEAVDALHEALAQSRVRLRLLHDAEVERVAFSPDGQIVAATTHDGKLTLWSATSGKPLHVLEKAWPGPLVFSPDGKQLAYPGAVVEVATGQRTELQADAFRNPIGESVAFSPDGSQVIFGGCDHMDRAGCTTLTSRAWDAKTPRLVASQDLAFGNFMELYRRFSVDGRLLFTLTMKDGRARLWDTTRDKPLIEFQKDQINGAAAFSPSGHVLAAFLTSGDIGLWDTRTGKEVGRFDSGTKRAEDMAVSPDGTLIAVLSGGSVRLWRRTEDDLEPVGLPAAGNVQQMRFSPDGTFLALTSARPTVDMIQVGPGREPRLFALAGHDGAVREVAFSPDGKRLATASRDRTVRVWDLTGAGEWQPVPPAAAAFALSPDGSRLATVPAEKDNTIRVWDLATSRARDLTGHEQRVTRVVFSPEGSRVASASEDKTARIWDLERGRSERVLQPDDGVGGVVFSPDGRRVATASPAKVAVWDAESGGELFAVADAADQVFDVAFSPDGRLLAACADKVAIVWDSQNGRERHRLTGHSDLVTELAFSPDGRHLVTGSLDGTARVWDVVSGRLVRTLSGDNDGVSAVAFSPDGRRLATAAHESPLRIWDSETGEELLTLAVDGTVDRMAFTRDGRRLLALTTDERLRGYRLDTDDLLESSRAYVSRALTPEERKRHLTASPR